MPAFVGLDIGGTKLMVGVGDARGNVRQTVREWTPRSLSEGLRLIDAMINGVLAGERPAGIGVAVGGPLDFLTGVVSPLHQPEWRDVPLAAQLRARWDCPVHVDVDTNIAAVGEYVAGGYTDARFLYLTLSTGMGGGFLIDGEVYRGSKGRHPEVAHQAVPFRCAHAERVACACGAHGCLEGLVSGTALRRIYGRPAEELDDAAWDDVAWNLGQGLRNLATIYLPDVIVLGGGIAHGRGSKLTSAASRVMRDHLRLVTPPDVRVSLLGYDTALVGALIAGGMAATRAVRPNPS